MKIAYVSDSGKQFDNEADAIAEDMRSEMRENIRIFLKERVDLSYILGDDIVPYDYLDVVSDSIYNAFADAIVSDVGKVYEEIVSFVTNGYSVG